MTQIEKIKIKCGNGPRHLFFIIGVICEICGCFFIPMFICGFSI